MSRTQGWHAAQQVPSRGGGDGPIKWLPQLAPTLHLQPHLRLQCAPRSLQVQRAPHCLRQLHGAFARPRRASAVSVTAGTPSVSRPAKLIVAAAAGTALSSSAARGRVCSTPSLLRSL